MTDEVIHDVAVVGCGPAGLSAALNAGWRNVDLVLLGSSFCSPKLYRAAEINNYLGFYNISGEELRQSFLKHVQEMGINIRRSKVDNVYFQGDYYSLVSRDKMYHAYAVVLAVGVSNEKYLEGEERLLGRGVSYCAICDGPLYRRKKIACIAYTDEGIKETEYLAELADKVYFISQFDSPIDSLKLDNVAIINDKPVAIEGDARVERIKLEDKYLEVEGVFIFREITPPDKIIFGLEIEEGHIKVNKYMGTNLPGLFAAGDCTGTPYQLARAVGQGQIAGLNAAAFIRQKRKKED